jgi:Leucine-rich repeat (LRR) protein
MLRCLMLLSSILTVAISQNVNLNCLFADMSGVYRCLLRNANVADNESQNIIIGGNHIFGRSNSDVKRIDLSDSTTPFVISQFFTTFPNLDTLVVQSSGLTRVQGEAFRNAANLDVLAFGRNPIQALGAGAFRGLDKLTRLSVYDSDLATIDEEAFEGLESVDIVFLSGNKIQTLHRNTFKPFVNLYFISLADNAIESLHGDIFSGNRFVQQIQLQNNRINALGSSFLDNLSYLNFLDMQGNRCVSASWSLTSLEQLRALLKPCFENFIDSDVKIFTFELHGTLLIRDEKGNEILKL